MFNIYIYLFIYVDNLEKHCSSRPRIYNDNPWGHVLDDVADDDDDDDDMQCNATGT